MSAINSATAQNTPVTSETSKTQGNPNLGKDEFLKLLMAQLSQQDPLSPMDSQAFVAQLAQFANVEQLQGINSRLDSQLLAQASNNQTQTATLVGKDVAYKSDTVELKAGSSATFSAHLGGEAASMTAVVKDGSGRVVRTLQLGGASAGDHTLTWDGRDDGGALCPPGNYKVSVTAADVKGSSVTVDSRMHARVTGVSFDAGYAELMLGTQRIKLSDVLEINQPN